MSVNVWASCGGVGAGLPGEGGGYHFSLSFTDLSDLDRQLAAQHLRGTVARLSITAHGDMAGQVLLGTSVLNVTRLPYFTADFERLRWYLTISGDLAFVSCIAGKGSDGSRLLQGVSRLLGDRRVIGFEVFIGPGAVAGQLREACRAAMEGQCLPGSIVTPPTNPDVPMLLTMGSPFAKWVRGGRVIRLPVFERLDNFASGDHRRMCGNPGCVGHACVCHWCAGFGPGEPTNRRNRVNPSDTIMHHGLCPFVFYPR